MVINLCKGMTDVAPEGIGLYVTPSDVLVLDWNRN